GRAHSGLGTDLAAAEEALDLVPDRALLVHDLGGDRPRALEQRAVAAQACELEAEEPGLTGSGQVALAAQLEVALGELEAVGRLDQRIEPRLRRFRQLLLLARDEEAVRLLRPASHTTPQLVEL